MVTHFPVPIPGTRPRLGSVLERGFVVRSIDVDRAHIHTMLDRVPDQLRRCIKPHRLAVEEGREKHIRIVALQPARRIDEQCKGCRVAFRKAVGAEPLYLFETRYCKVARIIFGEHAADELLTEDANPASSLERRHRSPQTIRFARREAGTNDGDLHRLLLEQWHALGFSEDRLKFWRWIGDILLAKPRLEIRLHQSTLGGPRATDRDF